MRSMGWSGVTRATGLALLLAACVREVDEQPDSTAGTTASAAGNVQPVPVQQIPATAPLRLEVNLAARELYVLENGTATDTFPVAVGTEEWPTQTGEWRITQVVWNPEWVPPKEEWAKDEKPKDPGDADNPLGRVQLVYDPPRSIHGTNEPASIGKAASHGSIRMRNADIVELAVQVMRAGGGDADSSVVAETRRDRKTKRIVQLPNAVPIVVR